MKRNKVNFGKLINQKLIKRIKLFRIIHYIKEILQDINKNINKKIINIVNQ